MAITAIAGPLSNIALAAVVLFFYGLVFVRLGGMDSQNPGLALDIIYRTAYLSVALAIFNLLPIPPLDGSKVLFSFLSEQTYYKLMRYERFGIIALVVVLNTSFFRITIGWLTSTLFDRLMSIARVAFNLVN
jgi:Zn-dependent protease